MAQSKKEISINFGIKKISILDYCIETTRLNVDPNKSNTFNFNFELGFGINPANKVLIFILTFNVNPESNKNLIVGKLRTEVQFIINNIENLLHPKEPKINLPDMFMASLAGIVISTARGIWASKVMGTKLDQAILPIINPNDLLKGLHKSTSTIKN